MQFGIPISVVCDWLYQHWQGSLDEVSKPKLPLVRLMSSMSDNSSTSFTRGEEPELCHLWQVELSKDLINAEWNLAKAAYTDPCAEDALAEHNSSEEES